MVDARDVAQAMLKAVDCGKSGERYILNESYHTMEEMIQTLGKVSGVAGPKRHIPYLASIAYASVMEIYGRLTHKPILVSLEGVRALHNIQDVISAKAVRELSATFRPFEETLRDEVNWYRSQTRTVHTKL